MVSPVKLEGISPDRFAEMQQKISDKIGLPILGNSGDQVKNGVRIGWDYNPATQELTLRCIEKKGLAKFVPDSNIEDQLKALANV